MEGRSGEGGERLRGCTDEALFVWWKGRNDDDDNATR